jgi:hypothetical protein
MSPSQFCPSQICLSLISLSLISLSLSWPTYLALPRGTVRPAP